MDTTATNTDVDPTGNFDKRQFTVTRAFAHCETQRELHELTGIPLGTLKGVMSEVYSILRTSDKGKAMHLCWKKGIFNLQNCEMPKKKPEPGLNGLG